MACVHKEPGGKLLLSYPAFTFTHPNHAIQLKTILNKEKKMKTETAILILTISFGLSIAPICTGKTITVNASGGADFTSIQAAIADAETVNGDQIEVAPGIYTEAVNFIGKAVRLYSSGGPDVTTIDGSGHDHVVQCVSSEGANTILEGFTITGGYAAYDKGGGMCNSSSSPTVTNCIFRGNDARDGGGMCNDQGSNPTVTECTFSGNSGYIGGGMCNDQGSSPTVTDCIFLSNAASLHGGGMYNELSNPKVTNCIFSGNTASAHGGGMMNNVSSSPTVTNCIFTGLNNAGSGGGGMCNSSSSPTVTNCTFINNGGLVMYNFENIAPNQGVDVPAPPSSLNDELVSASDLGIVRGSGVALLNTPDRDGVVPSPPQQMSFQQGIPANSTVAPELYNFFEFSVAAADSPVQITSISFKTGHNDWDDQTDHLGIIEYRTSGGALLGSDTFTITYGFAGNPVYIVPSTSLAVGTEPIFFRIRFNQQIYGPNSYTTQLRIDDVGLNVPVYGGGMYNYNSNSIVTNCILRGDMPEEIYNNAGSLTVTYSDVQGGFPGTGNIDADPCFADADSGNLHLSPGSPCIDTGDNSTVKKATDLDGNPRIMDGDGNGTAIVDMGAYEIPYDKGGIKGTVVGVDSAGKVSGPLADADVTLSGRETAVTVTDSNGNFSFLHIPSGVYTILITKADYYGVDSEIYIEKNEILHEVFQLAYKSGSQLPVGYDFVSPDGKHFIEGTPGDISFEITVAWNGAAGNVNFCIGNDCYPATVTDLGGGLARASLTIPAPSIVNTSGKLNIDVVNGEGKHTYLNTKVRFHPVPGIISSWYRNDIPWMPSASSLSYADEKSWSWELPLKNKEVSFEASVGYNRELSYDLMSGGFSGSLGGLGGFGLSWPVAGVTVLGEGEAGLAATLDVCLGDGPPVITPGWQVSFTGKVGVEAPVILVVDVIFPPASPAVHTMLKIPVVKHIVKALKVRVYIIGGASIEGIYEGLEFGDCFLGSTRVDVSGTIGVEVQVEISAGGAAVGVYAGGTGTPSFEICPDFQLNSITIHAYVGAYAKFWWFKVSKKYGCTIEIGGSSGGTKTLSEQLLGADLEGDVTWELTSDSLKKWGPANRPVGGEIRELAFAPRADTAGNGAQTIAENVIGTASPSVVSDASQTMLLFSLHDINKPDYAASDIGTFESTGGGVWSAGRIADDSNSDFVAKITSVGSDSYLATWERISGDVSGVMDPNQIDQIGPHLEIAASWFDRDTGIWSPVMEITSNNVVDRSPLPIVFGSTIGIVWIQNDMNYAGSSEQGDRLLFSEWTGSAWAAPRQLWSGPCGILSISFASDSSNQGHIVFAVDLDGNTDDTRTDRELYGISNSAGTWTAAERLTNNDVEDSCPVIVNPGGTAIVVWDCNDTLLYTPLEVWSPEQVYSQYTLNNQAPTLAGVTMAEGAAIVYTVQGPSGVDIMASFYDAILDRWSLPRQLTFDEDVESAVSLGFDGDKLIVAYLKTLTEHNDVDVEIEGRIYHLENVPEPGRTDLCILHHELGYDLSVDSSSIVLEPANPEPGLPATIRAAVANRGDLGAENIEVVFYDGNPDSGGSRIGDIQIIGGNLIPGGASEVSVSWNVPADSGNSHEIFVVVDPYLAVNDRDRSNNTASKFAVLPDVQVKNSWSTELSPNSVMLIARIANAGVTAAKQVAVSWRMGSREGTEIGSEWIPTLARNGVYEASCIWDVNDIFDGNDYVKVFGAVSSAGGVPDFDERNNAFSLLVNNPSPESPPFAEAGPDQTVYAWIDGIAEVLLDGSGSYDEDHDTLTYSWNWTMDGNDYEANGIRPTIELPVGRHVISLIVNDGVFDSEPNEVNITVIGPVEAALSITPKVLYSFLPGRNSCAHPKIMAILRLPKGITQDQIDTREPILLYPGQIEADWTWIRRDFDNKCRPWGTTIFASFDKDELMDAVNDNGQVEVAVVGQLQTGQYFFGTDDIKVVKPGNWPWHRPWYNHRWNRRCRRLLYCRHWDCLKAGKIVDIEPVEAGY